MADPTGPEIAEHLEADGRVEWWWAPGQEWNASTTAPYVWRERTAPQPGYRLVPLPPKTERVMAWEAVRDGRRVLMGNGRSSPLKGMFRRDGGLSAETIGYYAVPIADDGTIEVLVEGPE